MTNSRSVSVVAFAIMASLLLATTPTAVKADAGQLVVGSYHDDADFDNATLTNMTKTGSGTAADVVLENKQGLLDGFEDGDISDYSGDKTGFTVDSSGNAVLEASSSLSRATITRVDQTVRQGDTITVDVRPESQFDGGFVFGAQAATGQSSLSGYWVGLTQGNDAMRIRRTDDGSSTVLDSVSVQIDSGQQHQIKVDWTEGDEITATLLQGGSTLATLTVTDSTYASGGYGFTVFNNGADFDNVTSTAAATADAGQYISPTHSVSDASQAAVNLTLDNATATVKVQEWTGSSWADVNSSTVTTTANHTLDISDASEDTLRTVVDFSAEPGATTAELHDESILFDPEVPSGSLQSPADGVKLTQSSVDFSIDVSDPDFGTAQSDSVEATLQLQEPDSSTWTNASSTSTSSNGTVTISETLDAGGEWEYRFRLEDSYGESTTTAAQSVFVPAELEVRSALPPHELINDVNLTVRFYEDGGEERVFQQTPTDGTISLAGLPTTNFVVTVRANESYAYRRIVLDSLYEQSTVYLLPNNATSSQIVFQLDDRTGRFDAAQTTLYIEAPITRDFNGDGNETTQYVTIAGDTFGGSEQFPVTLENNQRYRLRVENENGETRVLGSYTTAGDAVAVLPLGQVVIDSDVGEGGVAFDAAIREAEDGSRYIRLVYRDPEMATQSLSLEVTNADSNSTLRANSTMEGPYGRYIETVPLPAGANDSATYVVKWSAERNASVVGGQERVGNVNAFVGDIDIDPAIRGLIGYGAIIGVTGLVIIRSPRVAGVVGVGTAVIVSALGVVSIAPSALGIGGAIAVLAFVGGGGR